VSFTTVCPIRKARRSHNARLLTDPSLKALVAGGGRILPNGNVELTQIDGSTVAYRVTPSVGFHVTPVAQVSLGNRTYAAVRASVFEAITAAGLPSNTEIDPSPIYYTVREALGRKTCNAAVLAAARAAADLAVERYLDLLTTPNQIAAE
jgi:hypothetical protein